MWPNIDSISVIFGQICNFRNPNLVTLYLCMYLILNKEHFTFHLQYKHSGTFTNRKYEELSYPKNKKMCDRILVTQFKMRPHDSESSRENATPSSATSPLALIRKYSPPCELVGRWKELSFWPSAISWKSVILRTWPHKYIFNNLGKWFRIN